jgi:hypothetical protein
MQADKTISHYHTDPKIIEQKNIGFYTVGLMMYLDEDGVYKRAIANSIKSSRIAGMVWKRYGPDKISLRVEPTPCFYEYPLGKRFFYTTSDGKVDPLAPNWDYIPGLPGRLLYLSETKPGRMQQSPPSNENYKVIVGYKTEDGFIFRPERLLCCP